MCRIVESRVSCPFAKINNMAGKPILGDLVVHSPGNYTWEFIRRDKNHACLIRDDGTEEFQGYTCSGPNGEHGYAEHICPECAATVCSDCAEFDSRGDNNWDANHPVLQCPYCGTNVLAAQL